MMNANLKQTMIDGLWKNNPALIQMLGLCPLLAVSNNLWNGFCLGVATLLVLVIGQGSISLCRHMIAPALRLPSYMLLLGTATTIIELGLQWYDYKLYQTLGLFIPLIITNCMLLARAESVASKTAFVPTLLDALAMGLGFMLILIIMGGIRQWLSPSFSLMLLPPGAFLVLGLLAALQAWIKQRQAHKAKMVLHIPVHTIDT